MYSDSLPKTEHSLCPRLHLAQLIWSLPQPCELCITYTKEEKESQTTMTPTQVTQPHLAVLGQGPARPAYNPQIILIPRDEWLFPGPLNVSWGSQMLFRRNMPTPTGTSVNHRSGYTDSAGFMTQIQRLWTILSPFRTATPPFPLPVSITEMKIFTP